MNHLTKMRQNEWTSNIWCHKMKWLDLWHTKSWKTTQRHLYDSKRIFLPFPPCFLWNIILIRSEKYGFMGYMALDPKSICVIIQISRKNSIFPNGTQIYLKTSKIYDKDKTILNSNKRKTTKTARNKTSGKLEETMGR